MRGIPRALGCIAYLSVWREVGALCVERLAVFLPSLPTLCFPLCISVTGACPFQGRGGSWLGCQVLPAIGAVSILELAANSGSSRMFRAPNLQRATMLFTTDKNQFKIACYFHYTVCSQFLPNKRNDNLAQVHVDQNTKFSMPYSLQTRTTPFLGSIIHFHLS